MSDAVLVGGLPLGQGGHQAPTIIDLRGVIPVFVHITSGKVHDLNVLDLMHWPAGSIVVIDRGYLDVTKLHGLHQRQVSFVIRAKDNTRYTWIASREVDKSCGLRSDQSILLATTKSKLAYPDRLRGVSYRDPETGQYLVFLTNRFDFPALTIAEIYRKRWMVELFFDVATRCTYAYLIETQGRAAQRSRYGLVGNARALPAALRHRFDAAPKARSGTVASRAGARCESTSARSSGRASALRLPHRPCSGVADYDINSPST